MLKGKKIILGISASISAYKSIFLLRLLKKEGAEVRVVMTKSATDFVSPLVLSTLSEHPVWIEFHENGVWNNHVELGLWADVFLIAPATCLTLSKLANGFCDNILVATYLSARCPILLAPAMDEDMFKHASTQQNLQKLREYGNEIIQPAVGFLASGLIGEGRLAEPEDILKYVIVRLNKSTEWEGKRVLINAGPTQEDMDPVRFISNHSSGKMGIALAEAAFMRGAEVQLVLGPTPLKPMYEQIEVVPVRSGQEMYQEMLSRFEEADLVIAAAAVADYRPQEIVSQKIKKKTDDWSLGLVKNVDILMELSKRKSHQKLVGFALETNDEVFHAKQKMEAKKLDAIVMNSLQTQGAGFGGDTNEVVVFCKNGNEKRLGLSTKNKIAEAILEYLKKEIGV